MNYFCRKIIEADPNFINNKGKELIQIINKNIPYESKEELPN